MQLTNNHLTWRQQKEEKGRNPSTLPPHGKATKRLSLSAPTDQSYKKTKIK